MTIQQRITSATSAQLIAGEHFTEVEKMTMFNVDMVVAGAMDASEVRGNNRFLIRCKPRSKDSKIAAEQTAKIDPKTHEIIEATPERAALIEAHRVRVQADPELCPTLHK